MQSVRAFIEEAKKFEEKKDWREASVCYIEAASMVLKDGNFELSSELFMRSAISLERMEEWRHIGLLWLHSATALQGQCNPVGKGRYTDIDETKHNFPTMDIGLWESLSKDERIGRAFRNSGYHLEKAGTNQSAYKQYEMSGSVFRNAGLWDEASRSYMLAARSYINKHGELDIALLYELEISLEKLRKEDNVRYLKRLILYYRYLRVDLTNRGNAEQANTLFVKECRAKTELYGLQKRPFTKSAFTLWNITSRYGTSFNRWLLISSIFSFLFFPPFIYL